jgi:hypothetical protein
MEQSYYWETDSRSSSFPVFMESEGSLPLSPGVRYYFSRYPDL